MEERLRILIIGAGGIGAYYGARLQTAGHPVVFVARGDHLAAMQTNGLRVAHPDFQFDAPVQAVSMEGLIQRHRAGAFSLVILTTKAGATPQIMCELRAWLGETAGPLVLSLQNGIDNENQIAAVVGEARTVAGLAVRIGGHVIRPGLIEATGPAQVVLGAWPNAATHPATQAGLAAVTDAFNAAGIPTRAAADMRLELWKKLLINNGVNPLSALTALDTRALSNHPVLGDSVYRLMQEAAVAARSDGVEIGSADTDAMFDLIRTFDPIKTSMLVDYEKDRELELEEIAGAVIERCARIGERAPITELVKGLLDLKLIRRHARA